MKKVELGGKRIGNRSTMDVEVKGYERSTFNKNTILRTTMSPGTIVPFVNEVTLPGDTWEIDVELDVKTKPTIGPLFGSFKIEAFFFTADFRLYNSLLHNNMLDIATNMQDILLPVIELESTGQYEGVVDWDNSQINPSSLLAYLGIRGVGFSENPEERLFNGVKHLMYWDVYKNYFANKQENDGVFVNTLITGNVISIESMVITDILTGTPWLISQMPPGGTWTPPMPGGSLLEITIDNLIGIPIWSNVEIDIDGFGKLPILSVFDNWQQPTPSTFTSELKHTYDGRQILSWNYIDGSAPIIRPPRVERFELSNIDNMRIALLQHYSTTVPFVVNQAGVGMPYDAIGEKVGGIPVDLGSQQGLGIKTYNSDIFNNWIKTSTVTDINSRSRVNITAGSFSMDALILARKMYDYLNRVALAGNTYEDWMEMSYDVEVYTRPEIPVFEGGIVREIVFDEVISNSSSDGQVLGTLAGRGTMGHKKVGGKIHVNIKEGGYLMGLMAITPRIDYSQGNAWDNNLLTMEDLHKPAFDGIGFQDLDMEKAAWWSKFWSTVSNEWVGLGAGKQTAWIDYQTSFNRTLGNFAIQDQEMFMTLNRRYEPLLDFENKVVGVKDFTTYIDPVKYNFIFADTAIDAMNFWVQIGSKMTVRRKMAARQMPNL